MRKAIIGVASLLALAACAPNGAISVGPLTLSPAQTAHVDYTVATAVVNDAAPVAGMSGISPGIKASIKIAGATFVTAVETQTAALMLPGTSAATQALSAAEGAVAAALPQLGNAVIAARGGKSTATPAEIAITAATAELQNLPQGVAVLAQIQTGYQPTKADLAADAAALSAAGVALAAE